MVTIINYDDYLFNVFSRFQSELAVDPPREVPSLYLDGLTELDGFIDVELHDQAFFQACICDRKSLNFRTHYIIVLF